MLRPPGRITMPAPCGSTVGTLIERSVTDGSMEASERTREPQFRLACTDPVRLLGALASASLLAAYGCTGSIAPAGNGSATPSDVCEPTIARMVPPEFVMEHVIGGIRPVASAPAPTVAVSRELWASDKNYLGNDALWLALPPDGRVRGRTVSITQYQTRPGVPAISTRRLDGAAAPASVERTIDATGPRDRAATIHFPSEGCWEIVYTLDETDLRFVLSVGSN